MRSRPPAESEARSSPRAGLTRRRAESRGCVGRARLGGPGLPAPRQRAPYAELGDSAGPAEASPTLPSTAVRERHGAGRNDQSERSGLPSSPAGGDRFTPWLSGLAVPSGRFEPTQPNAAAVGERQKRRPSSDSCPRPSRQEGRPYRTFASILAEAESIFGRSVPRLCVRRSFGVRRRRGGHLPSAPGSSLLDGRSPAMA
jgi:hypothetical protein